MLKTSVVVLLWTGPAVRGDPIALRVSRLARLKAATLLRWACQIQPCVQRWRLFAYASYLFMVYWAGHFPCLLEQLLRWRPPPPPPTAHLLPGEVWRPLARCSLSGSLLPAEPDAQPLPRAVWIIYLLNLAWAWHFDVWRLEAPALTI